MQWEQSVALQLGVGGSMLQLEQLPEYFCQTQCFDAFLKIGFEKYWQITRDRVAVLAQPPQLPAAFLDCQRLHPSLFQGCAGAGEP